MKDIKLNSFTLDALELSVPWYEFPYNDETVSATLSNGQIDTLIRDLKKRFKETYEDRKASTAKGKARLQFSGRIASEGTHADRAARAALLVKENIFAYSDELAVYNEVFTRSKSSLCSYSGGFVELTLLLAPPNRQLKTLSQQIAFWQLQKQFPADENTWLLAIVEDSVASFIQNGMTSLLTTSAQAKLPQLNITAIKVMGPLTEVYGLAQSGTSFLMQQISSSNSQVAYTAAKELRQLKSIPAQAHSIIISLQQIQDCHQRLLKLDAQSLDARKRSDGTLRGKGAKVRTRKAQLKKEIQEAAKAEMNKRNTIQRQLHQTLAYLSSFGFLGGLDSAQLYADLTNTLLRLLGYLLKFSTNVESAQGSNQGGNGDNRDFQQKGQLQRPHAKENDDQDYNLANEQTQDIIKPITHKVNATKHEIGHYGIVRQVLRVLGRIFERAKLAEAPILRIALQQLLEISTVSSFGVSTLILELVYKYIENSYKFGAGKLTIEIINAFIIYLYKLTIRYDAMTVNKQSNVLDFYRLIIRVFKSYAGGMCYNSELLCGLAKRLIQTQQEAINPEVLLNCVLTLQIGAQYNAQECRRGSSTKGKNFKTTFPFTSPFQALPGSLRTPMGDIKRYFDIEAENPMKSNSSQDQFWENQLLAVHYHPSVRHFATTYQNNGLADFIDIVQQQEQLIQEGKVKQPKQTKNNYVKQPFDPNNVFQIVQGDSRFLTDRSGTKVNQIHLQLVEDIINESKKEIYSGEIQQNIKGNDIDDIIVQDLIKRNVIQSNSRFAEVQQFQGKNIQQSNVYDNDPFYQKIIQDLQDGAKDFTAEQMAAMDGIQNGQQQLLDDEMESEPYGEEYYEDEFEYDIQSDSEQMAPVQQVLPKQKISSLPLYMTPEQFEQYDQSQNKQQNGRKSDTPQEDKDNPLLKAMRKRVLQ